MANNSTAISDKKKFGEIHLRTKVPAMDLIFSIQNMSVMMDSGLSLQDTLEIIGGQAESFTLKKTYAAILQDINSGTSFTEAIRKHPKVFSTLIVSIVSAGEQSGTLEKNFLYLSDYLKKDYILKKKIKASLFYPIIILSLTGFELIGIIFFVLPQLESFFSAFKTDAAVTKIVLGLGKFVRLNTLYLGIGLFAVIVGTVLFFRTRTGRLVKDYLFLHLPVIKKLTKSIILANFARTFSILLQSGIPLYDAITISAQSVNNYFYKKALEAVKKKVLSGTDVSTSLSQFPSCFPSIFTKMIEAGERAGALEKNLFGMYEFYSSEAEDISNNLATLIEPFLLIFVGIIVGLLAIAVIVPLYQVISSVKA